MNTTCNLLWSHATVDVTGEVRPCCRFRELNYNLPHINDGLDAAWNGIVFRDIRNRMREGEKLPHCQKCWDQEAAGSESLRTIYNRKFPQAQHDYKIKFLEIGFSTHCNLACRMCSSAFSSKWWTIENPGKSVELGYDININNLDLDLSELEEIKIVGGEPMMSKQHDSFLELVVSQSKNPVTLVYYTNGTVYPSERIIDYWRNMKHVYINISVDGVGKTNDYQRPGSEWHVLQDNVEKYHDLMMDNITIRSHSVLSVLNIWDWHHFYDWHSRFFWDTEMGLDFAEYPDHLNLRNMPNDLKNKAVKYTEDNIHNEVHKKRIIQKITEPPREGKQTTIEEIRAKEKRLDEYFNQENIL